MYDVTIVRHEYHSREGNHLVKSQAYLVDEGATAGVGAGDGRAPEGTAEVDGAVVVGVDVRVRVGLVARAAVVRVARVVVAVQIRVVAEHRAVARARVRAEPGPSRAAGRRRGVVRKVPVD